MIKKNYGDHGYYNPGGKFWSFKSFHGCHQIFLANFELKKGLTYTLSAYVKSNLNKNPWNEGKGKINSDKAMFRIFCRKLI